MMIHTDAPGLEIPTGLGFLAGLGADSNDPADPTQGGTVPWDVGCIGCDGPTGGGGGDGTTEEELAAAKAAYDARVAAAKAAASGGGPATTGTGTDAGGGGTGAHPDVKGGQPFKPSALVWWLLGAIVLLGTGNVARARK